MSSNLHILSAAKYKHHRKRQVEWEIDNAEIKIITFVTECGVNSTVALGNLPGHLIYWFLQQLVGGGTKSSVDKNFI